MLTMLQYSMGFHTLRRPWTPCALLPPRPWTLRLKQSQLTPPITLPCVLNSRSRRTFTWATRTACTCRCMCRRTRTPASTTTRRSLPRSPCLSCSGSLAGRSCSGTTRSLVGTTVRTSPIMKMWSSWQPTIAWAPSGSSPTRPSKRRVTVRLSEITEFRTSAWHCSGSRITLRPSEETQRRLRYSGSPPAACPSALCSRTLSTKGCSKEPSCNPGLATRLSFTKRCPTLWTLDTRTLKSSAAIVMRITEITSAACAERARPRSCTASSRLGRTSGTPSQGLLMFLVTLRMDLTR
mmetsp:Transcript_27151/g.51447  ORF Transcript_27151/g.51447 Transcript_27151/m.51447 type:complete len:294 (+) Transcript_27151:215-1096(+)